MMNHSYACEFPEGCSCGASDWNRIERQLTEIGALAVRFREALVAIRTAGNDSPQTIWMQKVAAHALEPTTCPAPGPQPLG